MKKCSKLNLITIFLFLLIIPIAFSTTIKDCRVEINVNELPCQIISAWDYPNACNTYTVSIYNSTPALIREAVMSDYGVSGRCNITFGEADNETNIDSYVFNVSSGDSGRIKIISGDSMVVAVIILLPLLLGIIFLTGAVSLSPEHPAMKIALFIMSLFTIFSSFHFGMLAIVKFYRWTEMQEAMGSTVYWIGIILGVIVTYFIIYLLILLFHEAAQRRKQRLEY